MNCFCFIIKELVVIKKNTSFRFDDVTRFQLEQIARFEGKTLSVVIAELIGKRFHEKNLSGEFEGLNVLILKSIENK